MNTSDVAITTAKIGAFQAIVVALITGVLTLLTTLFATGAFQPAKGTSTPKASQPAQVSAGDVPTLSFSARPIGASLEGCLQQARKALGNARFDKINVADVYVAGNYGDSYGAIWCHTDARQVIFLATAQKFSTADEARDQLIKAFFPKPS